MAKKVKRVLIYRLGSLGDTVIALPALNLVARAFPDAERRMLTNFPVNVKAPAAAAVLGKSEIVTGYFRYLVGSRGLGVLGLWWQLVRWRPQVLVYLGSARGVESAKRDALFFKACGIFEQVGVPVTADMQSNKWQEKEQALEPESERLVRNIGELGNAEIENEESWSLGLTVAEQALAREMLMPVRAMPMIAVSVGTKVQSKDWGKENWRELLRRLGDVYPGHALVLTGAPEESEASEFAAEGWRETAGADGVLNLCGKLSPRESAACYKYAKIFVGHDSGPMHLAAAVQTTCVAIFAARNIPRVWYPHGKQHRVVYHHVDCAGCGLETCIEQKKKCITSITVDEVVGEVRAVLDWRGNVDGDVVAADYFPIVGKG